MTLYEKIPLPNGLVLEIWDYSRQIASDTTKVEIVAQLEVEFKAEYLSKQEYYDKLIKIVGQKGLFEFRKTRTFVNSKQKEEIFQDLLSSFKKDALHYLSRDEFPRQFTKSKYRDIEQHWYKYITHQEEI